MTTAENSVLIRFFLALWRAVTGWYETSGLHRLLVRASAGWSRWFRGSRVMEAVTREGTLPRAWGQSVLCRALRWIVNLPANLLGLLYNKLTGVFEGSAFARLGFAMGVSVPYAIGWLTMGIIAFAYTYWNNMYALAVYVLLTALFILGGMRRKKQRLEVERLGAYPVFFLMFVGIAWVSSYRSSLSFHYLFFHLTAALCVLVTVSAVEKPEHLMRLAGCVVAAMAVISLVGIQQGIEGVPVNASYTDMFANQGMPGRVYSWYENPNTFAQVLVMLMPLALALMVGSRTGWGKLGGAAAFALGTVAIVMTYSRASWVGLGAAVVVFLFFWKRKLLPVLLLAAVACLPLLPDSVLNRILSMFNTNDSSTSSRLPLYRAAGELIGKRPVRGAGLGGDVVRQAVKDLSTYHGRAAFVHSHNLFLQLWLETGLFGLLSFIAAMFSGVKSAAKAVGEKSCPVGARAVTIGAMAGICGSLVNSMADYIWNYPRVMVIFWFVFALMLSGVKLAKKAAEEKTAAQG